LSSTLYVISIQTFLVCLLASSPVAAQEQIKLEAVTEQGTFKVEIFWTPDDIGRPNLFEIHFFDPTTGIEIEETKYDISINKNDISEVERLNQISALQEFSFREPGSYQVRIDNIEGLGEGVTIHVQVTPEFHTNHLIVFVSVCIAASAMAGRINTNNLFRK
jgi:hypothetical protein